MNSKTNKMVKLSLLLSIALIINFLESLVPLPLPLPGVKLGLANCIGLIVLCLYEEKDYVLFNLLKVFMVALLRTGFGTAFFIGLSGTLFATIVTLIAYKLTKASIYGLSVIGAVFHALGQVLMVIVLYNSVYMINYLVILEFTSVISGVLTAFVASSVLLKLPKRMIEKK
jgi:heptaprenyl diphosphate synthase